MKPINRNTLFYGDNLYILRDHIQDESIDLIYLDPPFNSNRSYNVLFKDESGQDNEAQISAFDDSWHWGVSAEKTYQHVINSGSLEVAKLMDGFRALIGNNQMMAYLVMMTARLIELHRVLKPTGSIYLHCDPTASHYLKVILDTIFGNKYFKNEIIWKRKTGRGETNYKSNHFGNSTDIILFFSKSELNTFNSQFNNEASGYDEYIDKFFRFTDEKGRRFQIDNLASPSPRPNLMYEYKGYKPPRNGWAISKEKMEAWDKEGRIYFPENKDGRLRRKRYLDELKGKPVQNLWDDIEMISSQSNERLGFPTQKPIALLERIILASSNENDIVLDPFSGCGTAIAAAQKLNRRWIGIDITWLAIAMHKNRLKDMFNLEPKKDYDIIGEPSNFDDAKHLAHEDRYQFQWWALSLVNARPVGGKEGEREGKKGSDKGIDGVINLLDDAKGRLKHMIVQVKSGHVNSSHIRDLRGVLERENDSPLGLFITLEEPSEDMKTEAISAGFYRSEVWQKDFPKIQIITIEELIKGVEVKTPPPFGTFKKAQKVNDDGQEKQAKLDI